MQLDKQTLDILKLMSTVNSNIIIKEGSVLRSMNEDRNVFLEYHSEAVFDKEVAIYNLSEFLSVIGAFDKPELELFDSYCIIKQGSQKVKYRYANPSTLNAATKGVKLPSEDFVFHVTSEHISRLLKMSSILNAEDATFLAKDGKLSIVVEDKATKEERRETNNFVIELDDEVDVDFECTFKVEKFKMPSNQSYEVTFSKKLMSKWKASDMDFATYITMEIDSKFA